MAKDTLARGAASAVFGPAVEVTSATWEAAFDDVPLTRIPKKTVGCVECTGRWVTGGEFFSHLSTCPKDIQSVEAMVQEIKTLKAQLNAGSINA